MFRSASPLLTVAGVAAAAAGRLLGLGARRRRATVEQPSRAAANTGAQ